MLIRKGTKFYYDMGARQKWILVEAIFVAGIVVNNLSSFMSQTFLNWQKMDVDGISNDRRLYFVLTD